MKYIIFHLLYQYDLVIKIKLLLQNILHLIGKCAESIMHDYFSSIIYSLLVISSLSENNYAPSVCLSRSEIQSKTFKIGPGADMLFFL